MKIITTSMFALTVWMAPQGSLAATLKCIVYAQRADASKGKASDAVVVNLKTGASDDGKPTYAIDDNELYAQVDPSETTSDVFGVSAVLETKNNKNPNLRVYLNFLLLKGSPNSFYNYKRPYDMVESSISPLNVEGRLTLKAYNILLRAQSQMPPSDQPKILIPRRLDENFAHNFQEVLEFAIQKGDLQPEEVIGIGFIGPCDRVDAG